MDFATELISDEMTGHNDVGLLTSTSPLAQSPVSLYVSYGSLFLLGQRGREGEEGLES